MDSMSYRNNRPTQRQNEAEPVATPAPQPTATTPPVSAPSRAKHPQVTKVPKPKKKPILLISAIVAGALLVLCVWYFFGRSSSTSLAIDGSKYQAVFLSNGQVYFGKLQSLNQEYMKLKEIFYLQTQSGEKTDSENPQKTTTDQNNVQLIKLGDEIHGPEDEMIVSKNQILFYENLKSDGKVAQSIAKFKKPN